MPNTNRWLSPDSIVPDPTNPQSFNRYSYVQNNPINRIDPTGHISCQVLGTEECDSDGDFVDAPPTPDEVLKTWSGKESLPVGDNGVDVTVWFYRQMIGNANSKDAQELNTLWNAPWFHPLESRVHALTDFKDLVDYGEVWDFKRDFDQRSIKTVTLAGNHFRMDIVANIHYGYVGGAAGIPELLLYVGAGAAQQWGPRPELGEWWAYFDQPEDFYSVSLGIEMWDSYGANLTYDEFVYAINLWVDNGWLDEYLVP